MLQIAAIPACIGNYIWIFHSDDKPEVWVLDPGDAEPVQDWLETNNKTLAGILITHHHWDHVDGIETLVEKYGSERLTIAGPAKEAYPLTNHLLSEGDRLDIGWLEFQVLEVQGHTQHHIVYLAEPKNAAPMLFCGDTLFSAGCGRLKQGTANQLFDSLNRLAREVSDNALIYCGHEYTLDNLKFALTVEPSNIDSQNYQLQCAEKIAKGQRTVPSTMAIEKKVNPFLRCASEEIIASCEKYLNKKPNSPLECFTALRKWKDNFA